MGQIQKCGDVASFSREQNVPSSIPRCLMLCAPLDWQHAELPSSR